MLLVRKSGVQEGLCLVNAMHITASVFINDAEEGLLEDYEAWLEQLAYLQEKGVKFDRRVEHGMTHSLYIHDPNGYGVELLYELPRDVWAGDIDGALNYSKALPTEGPEALEDQAEGVPVFQPKQHEPA